MISKVAVDIFAPGEQLTTRPHYDVVAAANYVMYSKVLIDNATGGAQVDGNWNTRVGNRHASRTPA